MATHSRVLAWEMPWTEGPGGLLSTGCKRVRHDLVTKEQQQPSMPIKEKKTKQNASIIFEKPEESQIACSHSHLFILKNPKKKIEVITVLTFQIQRGERGNSYPSHCQK